MISKVLVQNVAHTLLPWFTALGLLLFMSVFIGAVFWVHRKESRSLYQKLGRLPLESDGEVQS